MIEHRKERGKERKRERERERERERRKEGEKEREIERDQVFNDFSYIRQTILLYYTSSLYIFKYIKGILVTFFDVLFKTIHRSSGEDPIMHIKRLKLS